MVPKAFPAIDVRNMYLDKRYSHARQRITQSHAGVGKGARINNDRVNPFFFRYVYAINQFTFVIALKTVQYRSRRLGLRSRLLLDFRQGRRSVDLWFTGAQQVQVRTVNHKQACCHEDRPWIDEEDPIFLQNAAGWQVETLMASIAKPNQRALFSYPGGRDRSDEPCHLTRSRL